MNKRSPYKSYASTGNLPSGMSMDDYYYVYVRKRMYVSLVTNITKPPLVDTLSSASQIITSTAIPASVRVPRYDDTTAGTLDDDAGSFVTCTADKNEEDADNNPADIDDGGDLMPVDWCFPGFIAFALLGPIVPSGMVPYRSDLLMVSLPSGNDTNYGRAALRKNARSSKQKQNDETTSCIISGTVSPGHNTRTGRAEDNQSKQPVLQEPSLQQKIC